MNSSRWTITTSRRSTNRRWRLGTCRSTIDVSSRLMSTVNGWPTESVSSSFVFQRTRRFPSIYFQLRARQTSLNGNSVSPWTTMFTVGICPFLVISSSRKNWSSRARTKSISELFFPAKFECLRLVEWYTIFLFFGQPKDHKIIPSNQFYPIERELVFDIDMTDYDDVRFCCRLVCRH